MTEVEAAPGLVTRCREWLRRAPEGQRFGDRPYASVQLLLLAAGGLLGFGVLMAVSTTIAASNDVNGTSTGAIWTQVVKEFEFIVIGIPILWFSLRLSPSAFRRLAYPIMLLSLILLFAVMVPGIGVNVNGARRWIDLGPLQLQPSELAKIGLLLWGADLLARKQQLGTLRRARHLFVPLVPGFAFVAMLIMLEPDFGTTCTFVLILLGLLWMVGMPMRYFASIAVVIALGIVGAAATMPTRWQRITAFLHPNQDKLGDNFHTVESLYALGSGGIWGVGLGQGTSKYWVPNASSDFVFAIVGEELGLLGCLAVLVLFGLFAHTGMRIAKRSADPFVRLAAGAATIWLCGQAVINIGYVTGLLPVTGIPLPFISAGGTSLLASFFVLGMLVSFARHEAPAVACCRRDERLRQRSRLQRWLRIPVPNPYTPPRRRSTPRVRAVTVPRAGGAPARTTAARTASTRTSTTRTSTTRTASRGTNPLRPTGTSGRR